MNERFVALILAFILGVLVACVILYESPNGIKPISGLRWHRQNAAQYMQPILNDSDEVWIFKGSEDTLRFIVQLEK